MQFDMNFYQQNENVDGVADGKHNVEAIKVEDMEAIPGGPVDLQKEYEVRKSPYTLVQLPQTLPFSSLLKV